MYSRYDYYYHHLYCDIGPTPSPPTKSFPIKSP